MSHELKVLQVGSSLGVVLPKALLERLKVGKGDRLFVTDAPDGVRITAHDPEVEAQMKVARDVMRRRRAVLRELAK